MLRLRALFGCFTVLVAAWLFQMENSALVLAGFWDTISVIPGCYSGENPWCDGTQYIIANIMLVVNELGSPYTPTADQIAETYISSTASSSNNALSNRVAIITGASSGIGMETARVLLKYGCHVIFAVRNTTKGEEVHQKIRSEILRYGGEHTRVGNKGTVHVLHLELSDLHSVENFAASFQELNLPLHYLINNAGIMALPQEEKSKQGYEMQFSTNHLGHFYLIRLLEDKLLQSGTRENPARVLYVTSEAANLWNGQPGKQGMKGLVPPNRRPYHPLLNYAFSKSLGTLTVKELQRRWGPEKNAIAVAVHPGVIETSLVTENTRLRAVFFTGLSFILKSVEQGASTTIYAALAREVIEQARAGNYYYRDNAVSKTAVREFFTEELGKEVWELSAALVDLYEKA